MSHIIINLKFSKIGIILLIALMSFATLAQEQDSSKISSKEDRAWALFEAGQKLFAEGTNDSLTKALKSFSQARELYKELGDKESEAQTVGFLGLSNNELGNKQKALDFYEQAIVFYEELGNQKFKAIHLLSCGIIYKELGEKQKAIDYFIRALPTFKTLKMQEESETLNFIARLYYDTNEKQKALAYFNQALPKYQEANNKTGEVTTLFFIGWIYSDSGDKQKALDIFIQALPLVQNGSDPSNEVVVLTNIADLYRDLNDYQKAVSFYTLVVPIVQKINNKVREAEVTENLAWLYKALDDKQKALEYFNKTLSIKNGLKDRLGIARVLIGLAQVYSESGDRENSIKRLHEALAITIEIGERALEASVLFVIGRENSEIGQKQIALEYLNRSYSIFKSLNDESNKAAVLSTIGVVYSELGDKQKALEFYHQSLQISSIIGDKRNEANDLIALGTLYSDISEYVKALDYYDQASEKFKDIDDKQSQANLSIRIGLVNFSLGDRQKATEFLKKGIDLARQIKDKKLIAGGLAGLGNIYLSLDKPQKAVESYLEALPFCRDIGDTDCEIVVQEGIAFIYAILGEKEKSLSYLKNILPIAKKSLDKGLRAATFALVGMNYALLGENKIALDFLNQALPLLRETKAKGIEASSLFCLMYVQKSIGNQRVAIFYGKQSINHFQDLRQSIKGLNKETQLSYLKTVENVYQYLADILVSEGRFAESQNVLSLLKDEEYFEYVRRDSNEIKNLKGRADLRPDEQKLIERYNLLAEKVTAIGAEFQKLDDKKRKLAEGVSLPADEQKLYDELSAQLNDANAAFKLFLEKDLVAELGKPAKREIEVDRALQNKLRQWGEGTVALYTIAGEDRYRVILTTPTAQVDGKTEIKAADLNKKIFAFRAALKNPANDPRPLGKELYDILIKPIEKDLQAANAKTLIWSLDGTLRYIPLAALSPDGKTYLVQKYQTAVITSTTRQSLMSANDTDWRTLGVGVSNAEIVTDPTLPNEKISFDALPGVKSELAAIVRDEQFKDEKGLLAGKRFVDADFDQKNFANSLTKESVDGKRKYSIVHIASHFRLGNNSANSFLLLGDGKTLTLEQISNSPEMTFENVELVTLSACNTAFGNDSTGKEVDSLATFIELRGAKSVMATLWSVADESTQLLMAEFYRLHRDNSAITKAEAMQQAQINMIEGKLKPTTAENKKEAEAASKRRGGDSLDDTTPFQFDASKPYAHPYFWSPFVLIGNWR